MIWGGRKILRLCSHNIEGIPGGRMHTHTHTQLLLHKLVSEDKLIYDLETPRRSIRRNDQPVLVKSYWDLGLICLPVSILKPSFYIHQN